MDRRKAIATFDDVDKFSFDGIKQKVKVVRIVDGDTVYVVADYNGCLVKLKCRLKDIDCAELKRSSLDTSGRDGYCARNFLAHLCMGLNARDFNESRERGNERKIKRELQEQLDENRRLVYAQLGDFDSFGRVLVTLKKERRSRKSFSQILREYGYQKDTRQRIRAMRR